MAKIGQNVTKQCKLCRQVKPIDQFAKNGTWFRPECKSCNNEKMNEYYKLRRKFDTPDLGTPCECCGDTSELLVFDHCHDTNEHRGWLCSNCNTAIGKLGDTIEGVQLAVDYLEGVHNVEDDSKESDDLVNS